MAVRLTRAQSPPPQYDWRVEKGITHGERGAWQQCPRSGNPHPAMGKHIPGIVIPEAVYGQTSSSGHYVKKSSVINSIFFVNLFP